MKTILMLVLALTVSGCEIVKAVSAVSTISDVVSVIYHPPPSDYEVAFSQAQYTCSQEGKKAKFRTVTTRTINSYTTADFDCVSLSSITTPSENVLNLPAPPDYK